MTERQSFTGSQLVLAAAGGALVGAAIALLLAPKTGRELRTTLKDLAATSKDRVARVPKAFGEATDAAREAFVATLERS